MRISIRLIASVAAIAALGAAAFFALTRSGAEDRKETVTSHTSRDRRPPRLESTHVTPAAVETKGRRLHAAPQSEDWKRIADLLTPDQAREMLEKDKVDFANPLLRAERAYIIIGQLCRNGYTKEAWTLIEEEPGIVREKGLGGFFRDAQLPESEIVALLDPLQPKERAAGLLSYWSRFSAEEFAAMDLTSFQLRSPEESRAFIRTMEELMTGTVDAMNPKTGAGVRDALLSMVVRQANSGTIDYNTITTLFGKDPVKDGFAYWDVLKQVKPELRATQTKGMANYAGPDSMLIRAMAAQDPQKTLAMTMVSGSHEANYIHIALGQWVEKDPGQARTWVDQHFSAMTPDQKERVAVAFIRGQVSRGEFEDAAQWSPYITNPRWKVAVYGEEKAIAQKLGKPEPPVPEYQREQ